MAAKPPPPNQTTYRNSKNGEFVKQDYAKRNPDTTQRERNYNPALPPAKPAK